MFVLCVPVLGYNDSLLFQVIAPAPSPASLSAKPRRLRRERNIRASRHASHVRRGTERLAGNTRLPVIYQVKAGTE